MGGRTAPYSIATGRGFSSPFGGETGPSAWTAPVYPYIVALAFRFFGTYTHAAAIALLTFNSLCGALTCWPIVRIARRVFNERVAFWSGWIWALFPYMIYWAVRWVWDTSLSALLLTLLFMLTLEMEGDRRFLSWFGYGLLWGVEVLTNAAALAFLPFSGIWLAYGLYRRKRGFVLPALVGAAVFWLTLMPGWCATMRSFTGPYLSATTWAWNSAAETILWQKGFGWECTIPRRTSCCFSSTRRLGEANYSAEQSPWPSSGLKSIRKIRDYQPAKVHLLLDGYTFGNHDSRMDDRAP